MAAACVGDSGCCFMGLVFFFHPHQMHPGKRMAPRLPPSLSLSLFLLLIQRAGHQARRGGDEEEEEVEENDLTPSCALREEGS